MNKYEKVKFMHLRSRDSGAITVASVIFNKEKLSFKPPFDLIDFGFAFCNPKDSFSREKGREIAYKMLCNGPVSVKLCDKKIDSLFTALHKMYTMKKLPTWLVKFMKKKYRNKVKLSCDFVQALLGEFKTARKEKK